MDASSAVFKNKPLRMPSSGTIMIMPMPRLNTLLSERNQASRGYRGRQIFIVMGGGNGFFQIIYHFDAAGI